MAESDGNEQVSDIKRATQTPLGTPYIPPEWEGDEVIPDEDDEEAEEDEGGEEDDE
ncbi:MAG: hypothetical protein ACRCT1_07475 [Microcoleaceae cyanobacterium]